jgi:hypothetical protein
MFTIASASSLVASLTSVERAAILFLRASAEANTSDIESEDFLLGIIHRFYAFEYAIDECLHFVIQIQKCLTHDNSEIRDRTGQIRTNTEKKGYRFVDTDSHELILTPILANFTCKREQK